MQERLPDPTGYLLDGVWAKSPAKEGEPGESLVDHTRAVLLRLAALMRVHSELPAHLGEPRLWPRLYWAAFIHDWGKVAAGFQRQVRPGGPKWGKRHEVLSLAFARYVAEPGTEDWRWIVSAVASHHRDVDSLQQQYNLLSRDSAHLTALIDLVGEIQNADELEGLFLWLAERGREWARELKVPDAGVPRLAERPRTLAELHTLAADDIQQALTAHYGWERQLGDRMPCEAPCIGPLALRGLIVTADHAGSAHSPGFERAPLVQAGEMLRGYLRTWGAVHPHQEQMSQAVGSTILVAPTGSGKTESALLWSANQRTETGDPPARLFYVLPYQASLNAMYERLVESFGERSVGLQHGKSRHSLYRRYLARDESAKRAEWSANAAANLNRLHVPPVRVLSPFQLLRMLYRLPGYEASLADTAGGVFIYDEIHAYETQRLALILSMTSYLAERLGARFCLMSATFPTQVKRWLAESVGVMSQVSALGQTYANFRRHFIAVRSGDVVGPKVADTIKRRADAGEAVLACCNTVKRAQELRNLLTELGTKADLLHSRFNARDRLSKERDLRTLMGTKTRRKDASVVLVATQVVEVSLDIDFDVLFTDPAPLDALLQRFGRVNRGRRKPLCEVVVFDEPVVDRRPYEADLVEATLTVLRRVAGADGAAIDESKTDQWLDAVYDGEIAARREREYRRARGEFESGVLQSLHAFQSCDELEDQFYRAFDGVEVLPECLRQEYESLTDEQPFAAAELLVPIRWSQYTRLWRANLVSRLEADHTRVVATPYDFDVGLHL